jgi:micrococcal nuclease
MPYEYHATVDRVIDGDTIEVSIDLGFDIKLIKQSVRMYGINAPESRTKDLDEKVLGLAAKARLQELVEGKEVIIKTHLDKTGKFGRLLGEIFIHDLNINQTLLTEGHAVAYFGGKR